MHTRRRQWVRRVNLGGGWRLTSQRYELSWQCVVDARHIESEQWLNGVYLSLTWKSTRYYVWFTHMTREHPNRNNYWLRPDAIFRTANAADIDWQTLYAGIECRILSDADQLPIIQQFGQRALENDKQFVWRVPSTLWINVTYGCRKYIFFSLIEFLYCCSTDCYATDFYMQNASFSVFRTF